MDFEGAQRWLRKNPGTAWLAIDIVTGLGSGVSVLLSWFDSTPWATAIAVVTAGITILVIRVVFRDLGLKLWNSIARKLGLGEIAHNNAPLVAPMSGSAGGLTASDHLCRLWLLEKKLTQFDDAIQKAVEWKEKSKLAFEAASKDQDSLDKVEAAKGAASRFLNELETAENVYLHCFIERHNLALNPYTGSEIPLAGIDDVPEDLRPRFRWFHDAVESLRTKEPKMRQAFEVAIRTSEAFVGLQAEKAL